MTTSAHDGPWSVFNSGGACVVEGVSFEIAADYMTADRFTRGWNMVSCNNVTSMEQLQAHAPAQAALKQARAEVERKSDAVQRLWRERDELRAEVERLTRELALAHQAISNAVVLAALKSPTPGKDPA